MLKSWRLIWRIHGAGKRRNRGTRFLKRDLFTVSAEARMPEGQISCGISKWLWNVPANYWMIAFRNIIRNIPEANYCMNSRSSYLCFPKDLVLLYRWKVGYMGWDLNFFFPDRLLEKDRFCIWVLLNYYAQVKDAKYEVYSQSQNFPRRFIML